MTTYNLRHQTKFSGLFRTIFLFLTLISMVSPRYVYAKSMLQQNPTRDRAQALLDTLTPEERVGQLL
jgi:hypothetical protein